MAGVVVFFSILGGGVICVLVGLYLFSASEGQPFAPVFEPVAPTKVLSLRRADEVLNALSELVAGPLNLKGRAQLKAKLAEAKLSIMTIPEEERHRKVTPTNAKPDFVTVPNEEQEEPAFKQLIAKYHYYYALACVHNFPHFDTLEIAVGHLRNAVSSKPDSIACFKLLARCCACLDKRQEAINAASDALELAKSATKDSSFLKRFMSLRHLRTLLRDVKGAKDLRSVSGISEQLPPSSEELREAQLDALRAAVPKGIPERMRATIQINEIRQKTFGREPTLGSDWVTVEKGETTKYAVDMILEMTEKERAIIKQYDLDLLVLEDVAAYSEIELIDQKLQDREETKSIRGVSQGKFLRRAIKEQIDEISLEHMKAKRNITRIGDLLVAPFTRTFDTPHEANEYAKEIETKFLPYIEGLLNEYSEFKKTRVWGG